MSFHEVQFPTDISYGSQGGPGYNTNIITLDSGQEQRIARWSDARRQYNVAYGVRSHSQLANLIEFYLARQGAAFGFRYKDFHDCTSSASGVDSSLGGEATTNEDQVILRISATTPSTYQLRKAYTSGTTTKYRSITKPVSGTMKVSVDTGGGPVAQTETTDYTVNYETGVVTFISGFSPTATVRAGFEFDVPVRFSESSDELLSTSIDSFGEGSGLQILLVEILNEVVTQQDYNFGGSQDIALATDMSIAISDGRVLRFTPSANNLQIFLPDQSKLAGGGPYFYLHHTDPLSNGYNLSIRDKDDVEITTLAQDATKQALVLEDSSGDKSWVVW